MQRKFILTLIVVFIGQIGFAQYDEKAKGILDAMSAKYKRIPSYNAKFSASLINEAYNRADLVTGLGFWISPGAVVKMDYQLMLNETANSNGVNMFNMGIGIWF